MHKVFSITGLQQMIASIQAVPAAVHLPVAVALVTGLMLMLFGGRVLRPAFIILGASIGSVIGSLLLPNFAPDAIFGTPSPVIGLGVGAVLGGLVALAIFRLAMGVCSAATLGALAALSAGVYLSHTPGALPAAPPADSITSAWNSGAGEAARAIASDHARRLSATVTGKTPESDTKVDLGTAAGKTRDFLDTVFKEAHEYWDKLPGDSRITLVAALLGGAMLGFVLGTVAPRKGAAVVTSLLGAGLLVASLAWLTHGFDLPGRAVFDRGPNVWLGAWLLPALAGVVFQLSRHDRRLIPTIAPAPGTTAA